ncbi:FtsX-like permease family protein [Peribacillus sp. SCS-155]|uniref:FtsX-like permease family protein n=1 Tax=Peribacillus sedimenti TaxID=3115297 RepID=UPI003905EB09
MTVFNLARRNIQKDVQQYLLYFYPMVCSIIIYFTFVSLQYNRQIIGAAGMLDKIEPAFAASSIFLLIFAAFFIWYSNAFFMRKRKKEIALYTLFGFPKKKVAQLLFCENILLGIAAIIIGILAGAFLSKLFAMLLVKLMGFFLSLNSRYLSKLQFRQSLCFPSSFCSPPLITIGSSTGLPCFSF